MPTRRKILGYLLSSSIGASLVTILYPIVRYLIPPSNPEAATLTVVAAKSDQLPPNSGRIFKFGTRPGLVVRTSSGELKAFAAICTHLNCTVQYRSDRQDIYCACHEGLYDLNGTPTAGPPPRPLEEYAVKESHGEVSVSRIG